MCVRESVDGGAGDAPGRGGPSSLLVAGRAVPFWSRPWGPGLPSWAPGLSSFPQPWLLESAYSCLVPHAQMWACVPTQVGAGHTLGEGGVQEGSRGQPGGEGLCARSLPLLAPLGRRGEDEVCWAPPPPVWCPSSGLELGKSPLLAPECEALGVLICLPSVARR